MWQKLLRDYAIVVLAIAVLFGGMFYLRSTEPRPVPPRAADFTLIGPQGAPVVVQLPELAKVPPLDLPAACALVKQQNDRMRVARNENGANPPGFDINRYIRAAAEGACDGTTERGYHFYQELGEALGAPTQKSRDDTYQMIAALREALRAATAPEDVAETLRELGTRGAPQADRLSEPDLFLIGAETMALRVRYCDLDPSEAAACRAASHMQRGSDLFDAGRWRADVKLLRESIAANRDALRDTREKSDDWVELHARIGNALAQISEREDGEARRPWLRQALDEYELARGAVDPTDHPTWAMINQNVCSIRQPLAAIDRDQAGTRLAIEECDKARAHYAERKDRNSEAAAHYNMARAFEKLADWDQDEAAALAAVAHVRRTVQLYAEDNATLSVAFAQVHLADALFDASTFAAKRPDSETPTKARALIDEARASLDAAEPVLRDAKASGYLASLALVRRRLKD